MAERKKETETGGAIAGLEKITVEAVVHGALMRMDFAGVEPLEALEAIRAHDPNAKFREDFPRGGRGSERQTKSATALCINGRRTDAGTFIELGSRGDGDDFTVAVSRKGVDVFLEDVRRLGKLTSEHQGKLNGLAEKSGSTFIPLGEAEQFQVCYWTSDDGRRYLDRIGGNEAAT